MNVEAGLPQLAEGQQPWVEGLCRAEYLPASYADAVRDYVAPLAKRIARLQQSLARTAVVGISGAQGSGKSTLALFAANWLRRELGLSAACLSLDDLYLDKAGREALARDVHPLLATRGVPGTHDTGFANALLDALSRAGAAASMRLPVFDKASDDRLPESDWPAAEVPVDVVLFEGWCVGARPQPGEDLGTPINALEVAEDADASWRRYVNARLETDYAALFTRFDMLVMLRVPSFERVFDWRRLQERKLRARRGPDRGADAAGHGQTDAALERFIRHYERLTRHMLVTMPAYADVVIDIDEEHRMVRMSSA